MAAYPNSPFCCIYCAAEFAIDAHVQSGSVWCETHQQWTDYSNHCDQCDIETMGEDDSVTTPEAAAAALGKGVDHA